MAPETVVVQQMTQTMDPDTSNSGFPTPLSGERSGTMAGHRILVLERRAEVREAFRSILQGGGVERGRPLFVVDFAVREDEAFGMMDAACHEEAHYSLVFMDMGMAPECAGVSFAERLWELDPDLQVVFYTDDAEACWPDILSRLGHADRFMILKQPLDAVEVTQIANSLTAKWALLRAALRNEEMLVSAVIKRTRELESEIAERRRSEEALEFTQFSVDHASDAMFRVDPDSRFTYANATTARSLGYPAGELLGMSLLDVVPSLRGIGWDAFWESLRKESPQTFDAQGLTKDGHEIPIELTVNFFEFDGRECLCASARDTTRRRQILEELAAARDEAMESARLKGQFLANMSHEIRTPMNGVIGMSELMVHTNLDREQREYVDTIRSSAEILLGIINDILDSSKIDSGTMTFQTDALDLREIVESALDVVAPAARAKQLELTGAVQPEIHPHVRGDGNRLKQVLTNILGNAVKFTDEGDVSLMVSRLDRTPDGDVVKFEIRDTGVGLDDASLTKIFEPFRQADSSNTRRHGGTGLGLTICKQIVEAMGGEIGVRSHPDKGSTFWFTLTFERLDAPAKIKARVMPDVPVLVVDDNTTNREVLQLQLANLQIRSSAASSATEALELLRRMAEEGTPFALAILDMHLPEMAGLTLPRVIKGDPAISSTRLIVLSSLGDSIPADVLREAGVEEYVVKPVKMSRLEKSLITLLDDGLEGRSGSSAPAEQPAVPASEALILVAEDNLVNQKVDLLQLKRLGYRADLAADGFEVLAALEKTPYDLILMDCQMPGMDGFEATRRIRAEYDRPVRIVALTANAMIGDREKCIEAGMDDHLSKPVRIDALKRVLEKWLSQTPRQPVAEEIAEPVTAADEPPADLARLMAISAGSGDIFQQLVSDYLAQAEEILAHIALAIERRDAKEVHLLAHKLGGSSSTCGMNAILEPLALLERLARGGQLATALPLQQDATRKLFRIRGYLLNHQKQLESSVL
ncbi:MAG: response regulator [Verrucomicrobiaceae bacterium]|nr:MAG: response regulator [Verrucomicrobiaceae bacterium]